MKPAQTSLYDRVDRTVRRVSTVVPSNQGPCDASERAPRMRILLVTPMPPQADAPGAIPVLLHAQLQVIARHHDVTLLTVAGPDPADFSAVERLRQAGFDVHAAERREPAGIDRWRRRWQFASTWLRGQYPWRSVWFRAPQLQQLLAQLTASQAFDLIQVEDNATGIYRYPTTIPTLFTEHEVRRPRPVAWNQWPDRDRLSWLFHELDWARWPRYQRRVWQQFDAIQVFTERDAAAIHELVPDLRASVYLNPFTVALSASADPHREQDNTIVFVGNYSHPPNVDAALWLATEIMPLVRTHDVDVKLRLVGPVPPAEVRALAASDIEVTGPVPRIEPVLEEAALVVAPIRTGGGMRMKVLQAMALGKAVVTTPRGAEGLGVGGAQPPLIIATEARDIAAEIIRLLEDVGQRRELGRQARTFVEQHHSPDAYLARVETIYVDLISRRDGWGTREPNPASSECHAIASRERLTGE